MATARLCSIEGCGKPHEGRGYCKGHLWRFHRHGDPIAGGLSPGDRLNFLLEVALPFAGDDCLKWPYSTTPKGYGIVTHKGRKVVASRLLCELVHGAPPSPAHEAAHGCGKGHEGCVNPRHLRWATRTENERDRAKHGTDNSGARHPAAKLSAADVREIRRMKGLVPQSHVAAQFGIHQSQVSFIQSRKAWASLD